MSFSENLKKLLEEQENTTVGDAFGGKGKKKAYSITRIRDWIVQQAPFSNDSNIERIFQRTYRIVPSDYFPTAIANSIRYSFLIELTNLKVGSTKMKTRWLPGYILMPQPGSFEPVRGVFKPRNDPRSSTFEECLLVCSTILTMLCDAVEQDEQVVDVLRDLQLYRSFSYEFPVDYITPTRNPVHHHTNIRWELHDDIRWLIRARKLLSGKLAKQETNKLQTKTYRTDRALTGKDKTNRAKRWEVLAGDFQQATLTECWSVEKKLIADLVGFEEFPHDVKQAFIEQALIPPGIQVTRCPVTLLPLNYPKLIEAAIHGISHYQIGHRVPLKRGGRHRGENVCWQSADGNRIQGDLTMEETIRLLEGITERRKQLIRS